MLQRFIFELDEHDDDVELKKRALFHVFRNQRIIDSLYDDCFRPIIRYSENDQEIETAERIWKKCQELMNE